MVITQDNANIQGNLIMSINIIMKYMQSPYQCTCVNANVMLDGRYYKNRPGC